jgi:shikimate dehydrogenase
MTDADRAARSAHAPWDLGRPVLVGLLGSGIQLSRTPRMHEVEGARLGLRHVYKLLDTDRPKFNGRSLADILWAVETAGYAGINVTYPYKQAILPHLDALSDNARSLGAVNTVVFRDGKRYGHNTDLHGFAEGFRRNMSDAALGSVAQVGAGGAGSAVARALMQCGVQALTICDIDPARAALLAEQLSTDFPGRRVAAGTIEELSGRNFDGLVNTTPVGMAKSPGMPVPATMLNPRMWVADIIYFPLETELLAVARKLGCRTLSGAAMAVFQAVRAFELFTRMTPDPAAMENTFNSFSEVAGAADAFARPEGKA